MVERDGNIRRYVGEFDFRWNTRKMNDGQRVLNAIQDAEGKRLMYRKPANKFPCWGLTDWLKDCHVCENSQLSEIA